MATKLKVIALISGGKDSFFSLLHCLQNGHEVVVLANLHPEEKANSQVSEDIESYMYQTVGHALIPLYASALGLPLYRQAITGSAVDTSKTYSPAVSGDGTTIFSSSSIAAETAPSDETEALVPLLRRIMADHPEANGISTGAILSDYQRTRIESVALRLGLTPLSYLWQYPFLPPHTQIALLEDIAAVGQESRIIKVASGGLGEEHLWLDVGAQRTVTRLVKSMGRFGGVQGGAVVGEGGEFETITLDGPGPVWKGRIEVEEADREVVVGEGGSCALRIRKARVVMKDDDGAPSEQWRPRVPELFDAEFAMLLGKLDRFEKHRSTVPESPSRGFEYIGGSTDSATTTSFCNITGIDDGVTSSSAAEQMEKIRAKLQAHLKTYNLMTNDISSTTILLRSMSDFAAVNQSYSAMFPRPNPPARITVACGDRLPDNVQVMLSVTVDKCAGSERRGLHVQSRSYWAPANIGPYSQAMAVPLRDSSTEQPTNAELVYVAGQIPLVPASMDIVSQDFEEQTVLALQHLWRIGRNMRVRWWSSGVAFVTAESAEEARERAAVAVEAWRVVHERSVGTSEEGHNDDEELEDVGDRNLRRPWASSGVSSTDVSTFRAPLPDWDGLEFIDYEHGFPAPWSGPHCFVAHVDALPRGALIEWTSFGIAGDSRISVADGGDFSLCEVKDVGLRVICVDIFSSDDMDRLYDEVSIRHWHSGDLIEIYTAHKVHTKVLEKTQVMYIPCKSVWNRTSRELYAAVRIRGHVKAQSQSAI